ncbi:hypothetical protein Deipr_1024 [Deinococcus proteolyticus MRP]|uniref:Lipoprotein n=1 Tax=Deinococcus proteolyticus (strain ATCC 35074 / DSM 20540 / JCM 6276 / NBRC 101906 / NCIMB 13154 / VKM Ac-1939 / CCM 2703 / MRP) TaxID=693977 RepID=F0RN38_DEIPM|nr:hypothetical protein [Deinococcus proteolyticus]ADY26180.1 hypothetical protein Deipr_1024 [Deinococcus proteolyticus MRP]
MNKAVMVSALALALGACAPMTSDPNVLTLGVATDAANGQYLTGAGGQTIYTFKNDTANQSACMGQCLTNWPAVTASSGVQIPPELRGKLAVIRRADGVEQLTYNGMPLYYWAKGTAPGDVSGNGVNDVWMLARP